MSRRTSSFAALVFSVGGLPCVADCQSGETRASQGEDPATRAIESGIAYLENTQVEGHWSYKRMPFAFGRPGTVYGEDFSAGLTALAMYALASTGIRGDSPSLRASVKWCKEHPEPFAGGQRATYSASFLILALCRIDPVAHRKWIHELARRIAASQLDNGLWNYHLAPRKNRVATGTNRWAWLHTGDASNTQFAVLALWAAQTTAGFKVPSRVWKRVRDYHRRTQHADGGWSYKEPRDRDSRGGNRSRQRSRAPAWMYDTSASMTAAGVVASICANAGLSGGVRGLTAARKSKVVQRGLRRFDADRDRWGFLLKDYYFGFAVERVGALGGIAASSWHEPLTNRLVSRQADDGGWRSGRGQPGVLYGDRQHVYRTSLAILSLTRASGFLVGSKPR